MVFSRPFIKIGEDLPLEELFFIVIIYSFVNHLRGVFGDKREVCALFHRLSLTHIVSVGWRENEASGAITLLLRSPLKCEQTKRACAWIGVFNYVFGTQHFRLKEILWLYFPNIKNSLTPKNTMTVEITCLLHFNHLYWKLKGQIWQKMKWREAKNEMCSFRLYKVS